MPLSVVILVVLILQTLPGGVSHWTVILILYPQLFIGRLQALRREAGQRRRHYIYSAVLRRRAVARRERVEARMAWTRSLAIVWFAFAAAYPALASKFLYFVVEDRRCANIVEADFRIYSPTCSARRVFLFLLPFTTTITSANLAYCHRAYFLPPLLPFPTATAILFACCRIRLPGDGFLSWFVPRFSLFFPQRRRRYACSYAAAAAGRDTDDNRRIPRACLRLVQFYFGLRAGTRRQHHGVTTTRQHATGTLLPTYAAPPMPTM